jgi:bifunctional UDP-N-acetylglucosamine pyrophosphorylase / glucosamine-1-phosphate N-acetyltransferase
VKDSVILLAAGRGTRMRSKLPKVLQTLGGRSFLDHLLETTEALEPKNILVVVGFESEQVCQAVKAHAFHGSQKITCVEQGQLLGTGHAVLQALNALEEEDDSHRVIILVGDAPLLSAKTLTHWMHTIPKEAISVLTATFSHPGNLGRIVRDPLGAFLKIVEKCEADETISALSEVNTGVIAAPLGVLRTLLSVLKPHPPSGEYYLTDIIQEAVARRITVQAIESICSEETRGINTLLEREQAERFFQRRQAEGFLENGLGIMNAELFVLRGKLRFGHNVSVDVGCIFEGNIDIGNDVMIGPYCVLKNVAIASGARIHAFSVITDAAIGEGAEVGPYARLRGGVSLGAFSSVGNFVELKNTTIGVGAKAKHLSYLGDAVIGDTVNIGAGVVTCNYDGQNKYQTCVEEGAFIGAGVMLRAPLTVGKKARIGAGTTVWKMVEEGTVVINPKEQKVLR